MAGPPGAVHEGAGIVQRREVAQVRAAAADALGHLGVVVDRERNRSTTGDADVTAAGAATRTVVVTAREDLEIRRQVRELLG